MRSFKLFAGASVLALSAAGLFAAPASAAPCGYSESGNDGLYNHCPYDENMIEVYIDYHNGSKGQTCVRTGTTRIGDADKIYFAWSNRRACRV
ncbi:DUF6355 family natural product biosynthesis protein [Crossiella sp. CA-258035]|uniref:DUF6355 family natural product biosynthesis protein n=1 Tax=Crossiella sp. CA-258035 TaxID=2981138 RepID=UPI0024BD52EE|nr:DUF6355 family natural product biosynthesis protein [Crossiella sp. CA-258035]WHT15592.1 DUF6355 family natural product biosynthesis protein [Crossiella sp. CA-258035]